MGAPMDRMRGDDNPDLAGMPEPSGADPLRHEQGYGPDQERLWLARNARLVAGFFFVLIFVVQVLTR